MPSIINLSANERRLLPQVRLQTSFCYLCLLAGFIIGVPGVRPVVGEIAANSIAAEAQIAPGTELKAVDGIETPDWDAVRLQLVDKIGDESTTITVAPFGSDQRQDVSSIYVTGRLSLIKKIR